MNDTKKIIIAMRIYCIGGRLIDIFCCGRFFGFGKCLSVSLFSLYGIASFTVKSRQKRLYRDRILHIYKELNDFLLLACLSIYSDACH